MKRLNVRKRMGYYLGKPTGEYYEAEMTGSAVIGSGATPAAAVRDYLGRCKYESRGKEMVPDVVVQGTETLTVKEFLK